MARRRRAGSARRIPQTSEQRVGSTRSDVAIVRPRHEWSPPAPPRTLSRADSQIAASVALYLAGAAYRAGAYRKAIVWGSPALRSTLALQVLPSVAWLFVKRLLWRSRPRPRIVIPGVRFSSWEMPESPIPYERIYQRRFERLRSE